MPAQDRPYDIKLDGMPLILARDEDGALQWAVETVGSAIGQQSATEARYSHLSSAIELPMVWDSFHRGFGDEDKLDENRYYYSQNIDCRFEGKIFPAMAVHTMPLPGSTTAGGVLRFVELNNVLFAFNERYGFLINAAQDKIESHFDFGADVHITDACAFDSEIIVARGHLANAYLYSPDNTPRWGAATWQSTPGNPPYWGPSGAAQWAPMQDIYLGHLTPFRDRLNASTGDNHVRWCAQSPQAAGNWTAPYSIGDPGFAITSLGELGETLYIGKRDGLYALGASEDGYAVQITPELRTPAHADNCRNMRAWHGYLWVPHQRGFFAYRNLGTSGFTVTSCSLGSRAGQSSPVRGVVSALVGDDRWLYIALWTGSDTYVLAGREARADEDAYAPLVWHTLWHLPRERVHSMHIGATGGPPRLWMGVGGNIRFVNLPYGTDNPLQDTACTYTTSGSLYIPRHSWNAPSTRKLFKSVEVVADNLQSSQYIEVYYRADNRHSWKAVGGGYSLSNRATRSPRHVLSFGPAGVSARRTELRLDVVVSSVVRPPILRAIILRAAERPATQEVITAVVRCADNVPNRTGGRLAKTGVEMLAHLKELAAASRAVPLEDLAGTTRYVIVVSPITEATPKQQGALPREVLATVRATPFVAEEMDSLAGYGTYGQSRWGKTVDGGTGDKWLDPNA